MTQGQLNKNADQFLQEPYARLLIPNEEGGYTAEILEFPGCISQGRTADEAVNNLNQAAASWVEASLEDGREIPPPASNYDHSGKVALRMPRSLHRHAAQMAERNSTSLNQYVVAAIAEQVGANELYNRLAAKIDESIRNFAGVWIQQNFNTDIRFGVTTGVTTGVTSIDSSITYQAITQGISQGSNIPEPSHGLDTGTARLIEL